MVKTHLPAHMDSVRQTLRPKHQLLVLKCYPRLPKNSAADVKPNGSELSYLLYYAGTRRSKLQKVGYFLERKTAVDVSHFQSARVLVTLQILTALLENKAVGGGSGFALIAPYVLRIIKELLRNTTDISLIEASLETWESFCNHQDEATLKADHEYRELYESVVAQYAIFADRESRKKLGKSTQVVAVQDAIRLREAGLGALRSLLVSDSLASESGRQLDVVVPAILSNMRGEDATYLSNLQLLGKQTPAEEKEKEKALARRVSMATTRTYTGATEMSMEADPRQAEGTAQDADKFAEEGVAILALECLRDVFANENRPLVRAATMSVLKYISGPQYRPDTRISEQPKPEMSADSWASKLFEICTAWTPVQDRFVLIITLVETLVRLPLRECDLGQHLIYVDLIDHILYSDLNLIGLSVMDVLLSLVQHILRVLQINGTRLAGRSSVSQISTHDEENGYSTPHSPALPSSPGVPSEMRLELIERLKQATAHLGTHVYYTDQISDMISAILLRLKPNATSTGQQNPVVTAAAIEEPRAAVTEVVSNISLPARERPNTATSGFFSFETARQIALETVRDILRASNSSRSLSTGGVSNSRTKVPVSVWEGTQWLLRDPSPAVRKAYADALATWLRFETSRADMRVKQPKDKKIKSENAFARRALSNASQKKDKQSKKATNTFLQLLHLAVFENALQYSAVDSAEAEKEILILHFMLATLVQKLGVNAVQSGLPMIFALQQEMMSATSLAAKVRIGSLVHGYLWVLAEVYDFEISPIGQEIFGEIKSRKEKGLWIRDVSVPPKALQEAFSVASPIPSSNAASSSADSVRPFERRQDLIECIADSYSLTAASPSPSAPGSPGRTPGQRRLSASVPILDRTASSYLTVKPQANPLLPDKVREAMIETWTREGCLSAIAAAAPKSISVSGSHSSPSQALVQGNHRQLLAAVNTTSKTSRNASPLPPAQRNNAVLPPMGQGQQALGANLMSESPARRQSMSSLGGKPSSSGGVHGRLRVDDLKRVLSGGGFTSGIISRFSERSGEDTVSESLVDVEREDLGSESGGTGAAGFVTPPSRMEAHSAQDLTVPAAIPEDLQITPKAKNPVDMEPPPLTLHNDVQPPQPFAGANGVQRPATAPQEQQQTERRPPSRGGASIKSKSGRSRKELAALLAGIGGEGDAPTVPAMPERKGWATGRPPY